MKFSYLYALLTNKEKPVAAKEPKDSIPPDAGPSPALAKARQVDAASRAAAQIAAARKVYGGTVAAINNWSVHPESVWASLVQAAQTLEASIRTHPQAFSALTAYCSRDNYILCHSTNTAILAAQIGIDMGWQQTAGVLLILTGLLHEAVLRHLCDRKFPQPPSVEEFEAQAHQAGTTEQINESFRGMQEVLRHILPAVPENSGVREDSLKLLSDEAALRQSAGIISFCHLYEALSHERPWRKAMLPHDAVAHFLNMKNWLKRKDDEDMRKTLQAFVRRFSLYPPGSFVRLSDASIGRCTAVNADSPTRPVVEILIRADGRKEDPPTWLNLADNLLIHIVAAVDAAKLDGGDIDEKFLARLQEDHWWDAEGRGRAAP